MKIIFRTSALVFVFALMILAASAAAADCVPGQSECVNNSYFHSCLDDGTWNVSHKCAQGQQCNNGQCSALIGCNPGTTECVNNTWFHVCGTYAVWGEAQECALGQTCSNGQCTPFPTPTPVPQCSYYQQTRCSPAVPNEVQICNSQLQWQDWQYCGSGCSNGQCINCAPGARRCSDSYSYQTCDSTGQWGTVFGCGSGYICSSGSCIISPGPTPCYQAGQYRCSPVNERYLQRCNGNYLWQDWTPCDLGCAYNACRACKIGQTHCVDSMHYQNCESNSQWGTTFVCPNGKTCFADSCQVPTADQCSTPGAKRCSQTNQKMLQKCGDNNLYQDYLQCDDGCFNGACAQCKPNTKVCASASAYRSCSQYGILSDPQQCPSGYTCDNAGECVATPACTEGQRNCVSDSIYSCVKGEWTMLYHCPSESDCKESQGTAFCSPETAQPTVTPTPTPQPAAGGFSDLGGMAIVFAVIIVLLVGAIAYLVSTRR